MAGFGQNDDVVSPKSKPFGGSDEIVPVGPGRGGSTPTPTAEEKPGFFSTVGGDLAQVPGNLWNAIRHPFESSELGQATNFSNSISPEDKAKSNADALARMAGNPRAGMTTTPPQTGEPAPLGVIAGHMVSPYVADAAGLAIGAGLSEIPDAARSVWRGFRNPTPVGKAVTSLVPVIGPKVNAIRDALHAQSLPAEPIVPNPVRPNPAVAARMRFGGPVNTSGGPAYSGVGMSGAPAVEPIATPSFQSNKVNPNIARNLRFTPASDSGGTAASAIPSRVAGTPAADLPPLRPIPPSGSTPPAYTGPNRVNPSIAKNLRFTPGETQGGAASPATLGTRAEMMRQVRLRQQGIVAPDQEVTAIEPRTFANGGIKSNTRRTN